MSSTSDKIIKRISSHGNDRWVCTPKDFLDLGSRAAVDQSLSRLVKSGRLRRVGRGLYDIPRASNILKGIRPVDLDSAIAAVARRDGMRIMPDGLEAANLLGLTNAVPAKACYVTDGYSKTVNIDGRAVRFQHAGPRVMWWTGRPSASVVQALRWLGPHIAAKARVVSTLKHRLPDDVKLDLSKNSRYLPDWAQPLVRGLTAGQAEKDEGTL